jgi:hypothetical protein
MNIKCNFRIIVLFLAAVILSAIIYTVNAQSKAEPQSAGGAFLWARDCGRCHNLIAPADFSDRQWEILVHNMRDMGDLAAEDAKKILSFLQSAN